MVRIIKEDVIAFLYSNKVIDGSNGYTLSVYGTGDMQDFTSAPWDNYASQINNIVIGNNVSSIGNNAFYGTGITNINIPSSVKSIGTSAFESTSLKMLNVNSETIGKRAFANNLDLARVTIGSAVRTIEQYAFSTNTSLSNITFNEGLEYIRDYAFIDSSLGDIVIPKSVQTIGDYAFYNFKGESADIGNAYVGIAPFRELTLKK
ncbi:MAG: leucine-rich repeat domain-containing protein [Clostridium sp.]|nr:MAG: leucine-rich repeat domain-containing protein [Clostridium sp.]